MIPAVLYHYSAGDNADSIREKGLLTRDSEGRSLAEDDGYPAGVYLFSELRQVDPQTMPQGDVYEVRTEGLTILPDPFHDPGVAWYSPNPIPPSHIRWIRRNAARPCCRSPRRSSSPC